MECEERRMEVYYIETRGTKEKGGRKTINDSCFYYYYYYYYYSLPKN